MKMKFGVIEEIVRVHGRIILATFWTMDVRSTILVTVDPPKAGTEIRNL